MKYFKFVCYSLLLMLLFNTSSLYAAPPLDHTTHTPLSLMPEPLSGSHDTLSLAATWWLPDWQGSQGSRGSDDVGGGDHDGNCEKNYGMHTPSNIDGRYICSKYNYNVTSSLKCHVNCRCKDEYKYTSSNCSGNYTTAGTSCEGKYNQCVCKSEFKYTSSNCSGEYEVSGTSCGGNYNGCTIRPECTVSSMSCTYGCASYNSCSKCTSCKSNPDCSATAVSCDYGCASTNSCGICTSCSGNPDCNVSDKSCDCGCSSTNSCGKCTSCKSCPPSDPCSGVSCGSNAYCSGGSCYCNSGYHKCGSSCIPTSQCCTGWDCDSGCCSGGRCVSCPTCYVISSDCTRGYGSSYYYVVDTCVDFDTGSSCGGSWGNTIENTFSTLYECQSSISSYKSNGCKN